MSEEDQPITQDRQRLITQYAPLVKTIAAKVAQRLPPHIEMDDLISAGTIGLIDAVDKFDRARATNLKKYAEIRIKGAILDELRAMDHVTRTVRRQASRLDQAVREVQADKGRAATAEEVADHLGIELREYHGLVEKLKPIYLVSLEDLGGAGDDTRDPLQFLEDPRSVDPQVVLHFKKLRDLVAEHIEGLAERQRVVVSLYYYDDLTLKEIGKLLGVTESRISQVLSKATATLKKRIRLHFANERATARQLD
ncbi:MAG: FliA/WhiG family RNA polymerase sigma factor [Myxococcota bacterium]